MRNAKKVKTGKRTKIIRVKKMAKCATCTLCNGKVLGMGNKGSKTARRPSRIFGGILCSRCTTKIVKEAAKVKVGLKSIPDVKLNIQKYVEAATGKM